MFRGGSRAEALSAVRRAYGEIAPSRRYAAGGLLRAGKLAAQVAAAASFGRVFSLGAGCVPPYFCYISCGLLPEYVRVAAGGGAPGFVSVA